MALDYGAQSQQLGLAQLYAMLAQGGRMPIATDRNVGATGRDIAALGGYPGATGAAVSAAGQGLQARLRAQDQAMAGDRQRMNLQLLRDLVIGPGIEKYSIDKQVAEAKKRKKKGKFGALLGAVGTGAGAFFGGPAGAAIGGAAGSALGEELG